MLSSELRVPIPYVSTEAKRELPDFQMEERRAKDRLLSPGIQRPTRPMYAFVRQNTPDLERLETTEEMDALVAQRGLVLSETDHARWVGSIVIGNEAHTVAWYLIVPQADREATHFCTLRCSCRLPAIDEPISKEYDPCPAKDAVIDQRAALYRDSLGITDQITDTRGALTDLIDDLVKRVKSDHLLWPPSHRSDTLLVGGLSLTFGVSSERIMDAALPLEKRGTVQIQDSANPSIAIAA